MYSTLKRLGNDSFRVVSAWNTRGVFVGNDMKQVNLDKVVITDNPVALYFWMDNSYFEKIMILHLCCKDNVANAIK